MNIVGWILISFGMFSMFSGVIGIIKLQNFYQKIHAASVVESFAVPTTLIGLAFIQPHYILILKLLFIVLLILLLNPLSSHAIAKAANAIQEKER
ncbi:MAG: monovalent cation/H(+) antiporter subunit G [Rickettsiaceae bacterium]